jgi:hypothetical protein
MTSIALDFTDLKANKDQLCRYSKFYNFRSQKETGLRVLSPTQRNL